MYKRKIDSLLRDWKGDASHKPLVIKGCRQCGKTSSIKKFAYENYEHVVYIDFHEQKQLRALFEDSLEVNYLTTLITASMPGAQFVPQATCIIFDELQDCPQARASLKFWKEDGRYDVICTGSLLGVSGYSTDSADYSIPVGAEMIVTMFPMDFEEWLWANDFPNSGIDILRECLRNELPVPDVLHRRLRTLLLQYIVVGGMPEVVSTFMNTHDINQVRTLQQSIVEEYKADMVKYARKKDRVRIRECFESIPKQLSKENKHFQYSVVRKGGRSKEYVGCLQWIEDAGIVRRCYNTTATELPLMGNAINSDFKVYMADVGLLVGMLDEGTQGDILMGNLFTYKGAIFENVVADMLGKMGRKLYFYHKQDSIELDFLLRYKDACVPLECKARNGRAKSLKTVLNNPNKYHVKEAIKLGDYNVGRMEDVLTLPMYMTFLLTE